MRGTMSEERLNGLALMSIHRYYDMDYEYVLNRFAPQHARKKELLDVLIES